MLPLAVESLPAAQRMPIGHFTSPDDGRQLRRRLFALRTTRTWPPVVRARCFTFAEDWPSNGQFIIISFSAVTSPQVSFAAFTRLARHLHAFIASTFRAITLHHVAISACRQHALSPNYHLFPSNKITPRCFHQLLFYHDNYFLAILPVMSAHCFCYQQQMAMRRPAFLSQMSILFL